MKTNAFSLTRFACEEFNFRGWYDAAFRLGQETHQILFDTLSLMRFFKRFRLMRLLLLRFRPLSTLIRSKMFIVFI